jgi:hypothetical protein
MDWPCIKEPQRYCTLRPDRTPSAARWFSNAAGNLGLIA